jgi:thioredoxin reductase (NADPH)
VHWKRRKTIFLIGLSKKEPSLILCTIILCICVFSTAEKLEIDGIPLFNSSKTGKTGSAGILSGIARQRNININLYEKVEKVSKENEIFTIETSKGKYLAKNVIISTGFYDIPNLMNIPENLPK